MACHLEACMCKCANEKRMLSCDGVVRANNTRSPEKKNILREKGM